MAATLTPAPHSESCSLGRAAEEGGAEVSSADTGPDFPGPLFPLLAAPPRVRLQEPRLRPGLHAAHQVSAGPPLPPRQHLPGEAYH